MGRLLCRLAKILDSLQTKTLQGHSSGLCVSFRTRATRNAAHFQVVFVENKWSKGL